VIYNMSCEDGYTIDEDWLMILCYIGKRGSYNNLIGVKCLLFTGHYTTYCNSQSCALEDGQRIARNMLS